MDKVLRYAKTGDYARLRECIREALSLRVVDTLDFIRPLVAEDMATNALTKHAHPGLMARLMQLNTSKQFQAPSEPIVLPPHHKDAKLKLRNTGENPFPGRSSYSKGKQ